MKTAMEINFEFQFYIIYKRNRIASKNKKNQGENMITNHEQIYTIIHLHEPEKRKIPIRSHDISPLTKTFGSLCLFSSFEEKTACNEDCL